MGNKQQSQQQTNVPSATKEIENSVDDVLDDEAGFSSKSLYGGGSSRSTWIEENKVNQPTDKGFRIHLETQFGNTITVYGLNEESTMHDIEKRVEVIHGSSSMKTGFKSRNPGPPNGIPRELWNFKKDMKLKDLGIKADDTIIWYAHVLSRAHRCSLCSHTRQVHVLLQVRVAADRRGE